LNSQSTLTNLVYGLAYTEYGSTASPYFHDITGSPAGTGYDLYTGLGSPVANTLVPYAWGQAASPAAAQVSSPTGPAGSTSPSGSSQTPAPPAPVTVKRSAVVIIVSGPSAATAVVSPAIVFVPVAPAPVAPPVAPAAAPAAP